MTAVEGLQTAQRVIAKGVEQHNLQAQIDLARHIEVIAAGVRSNTDVSIKDIRTTRKCEQNRHHLNYMTGVE